MACVIAEMVTGFPLFDGASNIDQIAKIIQVIGAPTQEDLKEMNVDDFDG